MHWNTAAGPQLLDGAIWPAFDQSVRRFALQSVDLAQSEAHRPVLQRAIPVAVIHIDFAHLDAMFARVADDLRGGVEAHRLRVQQRAGERRWVAPLEPARHVDQVREARSMALGEAIFAEALDLV